MTMPSPEPTTDRRSGPTTPRERIHALDALRGFALCGIMFVNIPQTMAMLPRSSVPTGVEWFVHGRFYPIFVLLFGVGFGIFLRSAERRGDHARGLLARRFLALAVLGGLHHLLQPGEVLLPFAIAGPVVLLPLNDVTPGRNLIIGTGLLAAPAASGSSLACS